MAKKISSPQKMDKSSKKEKLEVITPEVVSTGRGGKVLADAFNEACREIGRIQAEITLKDRDIALDRFQQGCLLKEFFKRSYGDNVVDEIAERVGISAPVLYKAHAVAMFFKYNENKFKAECDAIIKSGKNATFHYLCGYVKIEKHPELMGGVKKRDEELLIGVERGIRAADKLVEVKGAESEEIAGPIETFNESMANAGVFLLHNRANPKPQKKKRFSAAKWIKFVKSHEPPIPREEDDKTPLEFHHLILLARGNAATDLCGVVLTKRQHEQYHAMGHERYEEYHGIKFEDILWEYLEEWILNTEYVR